jgi:N-acetylglucosamine kinase-like BadF-type ATPase
MEYLMNYFMGVDIGGTKTHVLIADEKGNVIGFGQVGPGNYETVGPSGMYEALRKGVGAALTSSALDLNDISGAGFGIAGYDWPNERKLMEDTILKLGVSFPYAIVNDTIPGLVAGAKDGWGVVVVSGTGCNCRGWDQEHKREAYLSGAGVRLGEYAGATELLFRAMQLVSLEWSHRGAATALTPALIEFAGAKDLEDLIAGYSQGRYFINAQAAKVVFEVAKKGDQIAIELIKWAGCGLGDMACGVIRQLGFEGLEFDVVLSGSMFAGGPLLIEPMRETITAVAPKANLVKLNMPPVIGSVIIGMEQGGLMANDSIRTRLAKTFPVV